MTKSNVKVRPLVLFSKFFPEKVEEYTPVFKEFPERNYLLMALYINLFPKEAEKQGYTTLLINQLGKYVHSGNEHYTCWLLQWSKVMKDGFTVKSLEEFLLWVDKKSLEFKDKNLPFNFALFYSVIVLMGLRHPDRRFIYRLVNYFMGKPPVVDYINNRDIVISVYQQIVTTRGLTLTFKSLVSTSIQRRSMDRFVRDFRCILGKWFKDRIIKSEADPSLIELLNVLS